MEAIKNNIWVGIAKQKCPHCGKGNIFSERKSMFELPVMHEGCDVCSYRFYREPGYFLGAMYISYGLAVLQGLLTFLVCYFALPQVPTLYTVLCVLGVIFFFSRQNYMYSRVIYMYIFPN
jgi:hypothetical protein